MYSEPGLLEDSKWYVFLMKIYAVPPENTVKMWSAQAHGYVDIECAMTKDSGLMCVRIDHFDNLSDRVWEKDYLRFFEGNQIREDEMVPALYGDHEDASKDVHRKSVDA